MTSPRPFSLTVLLVLLAAAAAGCVTSTTGDDALTPGTGDAPPFPIVTPPAPDFDFSTVIDPDHGVHQHPMLHEAGHGLSLVGHTGVGDVLPPGVHGSITSIDVLDGWAVVPGMQGEMGFVIVDVRDPANPEPVSWYRAVSDGWTARFSHDGNYVFYGCQMLAPVSPYGAVKGDCVDPDAVHAPNEAQSHVIVVDVTDKTTPVFVDAIPVDGGGAHNLHVTTIGGVDVVVTAASQIITFDREEGKLALAATVPGIHDATVQRHPVTGDHILFTGAREGFAAYRINDPTDPVVLFEGGLEGVVGWHEQTVFPQLIDGRWLLAAGGETFSSPGGNPDRVFIVDITDPANPEVLGDWQPPFDPVMPWVSYLYSVHEMAVHPSGQLAVSWYHGGVWVLDVSTEARARDPVMLAAYQPNQAINVLPSTFAQTPVPVVPFAWSVNWDARGYVVVPDMHTGVYVLEPEWGLLPGIDGGRGYR